MDKSLLPANISQEQFSQLLSRYGSLIESISSTKGAKSGQKTLLELDHFRYHDAVALFRPEKPERLMALDDVKTLVDWKLRHGKFRPTLMKLASSNDAALAERTIRDAIAAYRTNPDAPKAVDALAALRGIGPATASLLLAVHDPARVVFFSDEAYYWLCCGGQKPPIKYSAREYAELASAARILAGRLGVDAVDVEKAAYVVMREGEGAAGKVGGAPSSGIEKGTTSRPDVPPAKVKSESKPTKRKSTSNSTEKTDDHHIGETTQLRRSKRGKPS
ncbi:hypothetical protein AAE478_009244 [Parahypoxylon ruwenzoriense]